MTEKEKKEREKYWNDAKGFVLTKEQIKKIKKPNVTKEKNSGKK